MTRFVVQLHDATTLHFDLRLEIRGVLRSWAVPKGPSLDPGVRRLAVPVEDHSLEAGEFEGVHAGASRGTGAVIIWDEGTVEVLRDDPDHLSFVLDGHKLRGRFGLTRTGERRWILVKAADEEARPGSDIAAGRPESVRSGRTWSEVAALPESRSRALALIDRAFAEAPRPPNDALLHERCLDDNDIVALYDVAQWRDMPDPLVEREYAALSFLSPTGYRHFIPAYLGFALRHLDSGAAAVDATLWSLAPVFYAEPALQEFTESKLAALDEREVEAVVGFLEAVVGLGDESDREYAERALEYWRRRA